jgi:hypothetical protein
MILIPITSALLSSRGHSRSASFEAKELDSSMSPTLDSFPDEIGAPKTLREPAFVIQA